MFLAAPTPDVEPTAPRPGQPVSRNGHEFQPPTRETVFRTGKGADGIGRIEQGGPIALCANVKRYSPASGN